MRMRVPYPLLVVAALQALMLAPADASITPEARRVLERYLEATGGREAMLAEKSLHSRATITAFGLNGSSESWSMRPNRTMSVTTLGPFTLREGFDGETAWRVDQNGKFAKRDGKDLEHVKAAAFFENEQWLMDDQGGAVITLSRKEEDSLGTCIVIEVKPPAGRPRQLWFDDRTGLIVRTVAKEDQHTFVSRLADYRRLGGRLRARTTTLTIVGAPANQARLTLDSVTVNPPLDPSRFAPAERAVADVRFLGATGSARIPFTYSARHVWLTATVNGGAPESFLLDTGASISVIDSAWAAQHGLVTQGKLQIQGAGSLGGASFSQVDSLRVTGAAGAGVMLIGQRVAVLSLNPYLEPFFWRRVTGVLGYDFVSRFVLEIDYDGRVLTLHDPKTFEYAGKGAAIPMTMAGNIPVVHAKLDGRYEGEFRLDVGSGSTVDLHGPFVKRHALLERPGRKLEVLGGGFGGTFTSHLIRMEKMEIGPYAWSDPLVSLSGAETGGLASEDYAGNIGNQVLERFKCTLDYERRVVHLEPGKRFERPDRFSLAGVQLAKQGDSVQAMQVLPGSAAAAAGIRRGDVVLAVDGKPIGAYDVDALTMLFENARPGEKHVLEIERDGKKQRVTLRLKKLL